MIKSVKGAKSSVVFCMFDPTDPKLITALLATSDRKKLLYGLLNSISDPTAKKKNAPIWPARSSRPRPRRSR